MSPKGMVRSSIRVMVMAGLGLASLSLASASASALPIDDMPQAVGDALGVSAYSGGLILTVAFLGALALALSMTKIKPGPFLFVLLFAMVPFVAVAWLDAWVFMVALLCVAGMFASGFVKVFG